MPTINIYKKANGSLLTTPGDGVLFYTGDYSPRANAISGIFIDNPPTLPADSAALIWRYYADTDRYVLVHIQGSHALFPAEGRNYPFRGAYEVTLSDVNNLCACGRLPIASIFAAMPRIEDFEATAQRVDSATNISIAPHTPTDESRRLAEHIRAAIEHGEHLTLSINVAPGSLRANAVFNDTRLTTLLAAIEELPVAMARYATFAFNVDERHAAVSDDVLITIVPAESIAAKSARPWTQLVTTPTKTVPPHISSLALETLAMTPGPLATTSKMLAQMSQSVDNLRRIDAANPLILDSTELQLWLRLGHSLEELSIKRWSDAAIIYANLNDAQRTRFIAIFKGGATKWNIQGLDHELCTAFAFAADDRRTLRELAFSEFFDKGLHAFLFTDDEGRAYLDTHVTPALLERRIADDCTDFSDVVSLCRDLPYVSLPLWRKAVGSKPISLRNIDPLSAIDDLPADKQEFLRDLHTQHLTQRLPDNWKAFRKFLDEAQFDAYKRKQLTLVTPELYAAIIGNDVEGKRSSLGRRLTPDEVCARRYNELAKIGAAMLRKRYKQAPDSLADYATEAVLPALLNFCKEQLSPLLATDAPDTEGRDAYDIFCAACDNMSRYADLWRVFRRQFALWTPEEMPTLVRLAQCLCNTPYLSERSAAGKKKYRNVIINIAARLRTTKDPHLKTMASNLEHKALTKRQRLFRKIMGDSPERPFLHGLRATIICALCAAIGFGAAKLSEHFAEKPDPALIADSLRKDSLRRDSLIRDSLMQDYLFKDSLRQAAIKDSLNQLP